ncbi:MAG: iron chaperone [Gammaproteobacteria bacterium]
MPAFTLDGDLIYFAAFKKHIGLYPPVMGDENLRKVTSRYKGEKGNLKFPLDEPIPYALIGRVVKFRVKEHLERVASATDEIAMAMQSTKRATLGQG